MNNIGIYECVVVTKGTDQEVARIHGMAYSAIQATHEFTHYIFSEESPYGHFVEIALVKKLTDIKNLINPYFLVEMESQIQDDEDEDPDIDLDDEESYNGNTPIKVANLMMDNEVMRFDCPKCSTAIRVPQNMLFPFVTCPSCGEKIHRNTIKEVGGVYIIDRGSGN